MLLTDKRVFLVEDNQSNAAIIHLLVEQEGGRVFRGRWGGKDTLNLLQKSLPIDVLLIDLMLPQGITGGDVLRDIRQIPEAKHIPAIAVSASDPAIAIPQVQRQGFNGFIAKPVDFDLFAAQIAAVLNGKPVWVTGRDLEV